MASPPPPPPPPPPPLILPVLLLLLLLLRFKPLIFLSRLLRSLSPYHYIHVPEFDDPSNSIPNPLYSAVHLHLAATPSPGFHFRRLKFVVTSDGLANCSPADNQLIPLRFAGCQLWWEHTSDSFSLPPPPYASPSFPSIGAGERRAFRLKLHKNLKARILGPYFAYILRQADDIRRRRSQRRLFSNISFGPPSSLIAAAAYRRSWDAVPFNHPSTFDTLAMDHSQKMLIVDDLVAFAGGEEAYTKSGRAWKRGYLLHGPPGSGKSSLVAAMANLLQYDVYDLNLSHVQSDGELRQLLRQTTSKSVIVIEDIDCCLRLGSWRAKAAPPDTGGGGGASSTAASSTLSGLLNLTDGLWSCCGDERIFVFTANHVEHLAPALLRSGRMDVHIRMPYCSFPVFRRMAQNYLELEDHPLFGCIEEAFDGGAKLTPAQVSEVLIRNKRESASVALEALLQKLEFRQRHEAAAATTSQRASS